VILTRLGDQLSPAKATLVNFVVKYIKRLVPKYNLPDAVSFRSVLQRGAQLGYIRPDLVNEDLAFLQYTVISVDGTGRPMVPVKSVMSQRFAVTTGEVSDRP